MLQSAIPFASRLLTPLVVLATVVALAPTPARAELTFRNVIALPGDVAERGLAIVPDSRDLVVYDCDADRVRFIEVAFDPGTGTFDFRLAGEVSVLHGFGFLKCLVTADPVSGLVYALVQRDRTTAAGQSWAEIQLHVFRDRSRISIITVNPNGGSPATAPVDGNYHYAGLAFRPAVGADGARFVVFDTRGGRIDVVDLDSSGQTAVNVERVDFRPADTGSISVTDVNLAVMDHDGVADQLYIGDRNGATGAFALTRFSLQPGLPPNPLRQPDLTLPLFGVGAKGLFVDQGANRVYVTTASQDSGNPGVGRGNYAVVDTVAQSVRAVTMSFADRAYVAIDASDPDHLFIPVADLGLTDPPVILREFQSEVEIDNATLQPGQFARPSPTLYDQRLKLLYVAEPDQITVFSTGTPEGPFPNPDREEVVAAPPFRIGAGDRFGAAVASFGDRIAVGAPRDVDGTNTGTVTIYRREGSSLVQETVLTVPPGFAAAEFGAALSMWGNRLVVGAPGEPASGAKGLGPIQAAIFERLQAGWTFKTAIPASGRTGNDGYGSAVAIEAGAILVSAPEDDEGEGGSGSVFAFQYDGTNLVQTQKLKPTRATPGGGFGRQVIIKGGMAVITAPGSGVGAILGGAATLYERIGANLTPLDSVGGTSAGDQLGTGVALVGSTLFLGAPGADGTTGTDQGEVLVFEVDGAGLTQAGRLLPNDPVVGGRFGEAVAGSDQFVAVGSPGAAGGGAGYLLSPRGSRPLLEKLTAAGTDRLGAAVAVSQSHVVLGAPDSNSETGAASQFIDAELVHRDGFEL